MALHTVTIAVSRFTDLHIPRKKHASCSQAVTVGRLARHSRLEPSASQRITEAWAFCTCNTAQHSRNASKPLVTNSSRCSLLNASSHLGTDACQTSVTLASSHAKTSFLDANTLAWQLGHVQSPSRGGGGPPPPPPAQQDRRQSDIRRQLASNCTDTQDISWHCYTAGHS